MSLSVGQRLGELTVVARMGEGTHAHIYKVVDDSGSEAALKVLQVADAMDQERLQREGFALSRILHPNVVQLYDVLDVEGRPALLLQLIEDVIFDHDASIQLDPFRHFLSVLLRFDLLGETLFPQLFVLYGASRVEAMVRDGEVLLR